MSSSCEHEQAAGVGGPDDGRGRRPRRRPYDRLRQAAHGPVALELRPRPRLEGRAAADAAEASSDTSFEFSAVVSYSSSSPASMVFSGRGTRRAAACWGAWGRPAGRRAAKSMDAGKGTARAARGGRHDGGLGMGAAEDAAWPAAEDAARDGGGGGGAARASAACAGPSVAVVDPMGSRLKMNLTCGSHTSVVVERGQGIGARGIIVLLSFSLTALLVFLTPMA